MKRLKLLAVVVALLIDLIPVLAMVPEGDLSLQMQWRPQKAEDLPHVLPRVEEPQPQVFTPHNEKAESKGNEPPVAPVKVESLANTQNAKSQACNQKSDTSWPVFLQAMYDILVTLFTMCLFGVGVLQYRVYKAQALYMREGLRINEESAKAARQAADAAQQAANAATKGAEVAETALKLIEGADVVVGGWNWTNPTYPPEPIKFTLVNHGRTAARLVGYYTYQIVNKAPAVIPADNWGRLMRNLKGVAIPAQQGTHTISFTEEGDKIDPQQWKRIQNGDFIVCAFAYVVYEDVFGDQYELGDFVQYMGPTGFVRQAAPAFTFRRKLESQKK